MESLKDLMKYRENHFTIYAVDNDYANNTGKDFFDSYRDTDSYIHTTTKLGNILNKINQYIYQNTESTADYIDQVFWNKRKRIGALLKLAIPIIHIVSAEFHQAGKNTLPEPTIIVEGEISARGMGHFISKVREAAFIPKIIVVLKGNDIEQSKKLFQKCPNNTHIHFIKNNGNTLDYKVINTGASNAEDFLESYIEQCFSTCSQTEKRVIFDKKTEENDIVKKYMYDLLMIRSDLIYDRKDFVRKDISDLSRKINQEHSQNSEDNQIILLLKCIINIYKIYCNDYGGKEIFEAFKIANEIDIELISAFVWRYSGFNPDISEKDRNILLKKAHLVFEKNHILDQAIYCKNNELFSEFYRNRINIGEFRRLIKSAENNVPGLVGMCYIYNNVGVANLYSGNPEQAIINFKRGQKYAKERPFQLFGLKTNELIALDYMGGHDIDETRIIRTVRDIDQTLGMHDTIFLTANYMASILAIAAKSNLNLANLLIKEYNMNNLFKKALNPLMFGYQSLYHHLKMIIERYPLIQLTIPDIKVNNMRKNKRTDYLKKHLVHPAIYNTWL